MTTASAPEGSGIGAATGGRARTAGPATAAHPLSYRQWLAAAAEEYARLQRQLRSLGADQWQQPTDCEGWAVRDVVAHLAGAAAATGSVRELLRQARGGRRFGGEGDMVDRMNRLQVEERRELSPLQLREDLEAAASRGLAARRRLPAPLRALWMPFGPPLGTRPLGYLMGRIYTRDAWMHRVDIARATGTDIELTAEHDGALVADLVAEWAASHQAAYDLELTGRAGGRWRRGSDAEAVTIRLDAVEFARCLSGREAGEGLLAHRVPF